MLVPKEVHLQLKNAKARAAFAELARQSGYAIELVGDPPALADKRITLDTKKTTFWQAFDQLCDRTGLMERNELNEDAIRPEDGLAIPALMPGAGPPRTRTILLVPRDRWGQPWGTSYAGPIKTELWIEPETERKGICVLFVVSAEPRLIGHTIVGWPEITKALDEKDRPIKLCAEPPPTLSQYQRHLHEFIVNGKSTSRLGVELDGHRFTQIYLHDRAGAARFKELSGNLTFRADHWIHVEKTSHTIPVPFHFENVAMR
jgi:hypothetical protein